MNKEFTLQEQTDLDYRIVQLWECGYTEWQISTRLDIDLSVINRLLTDLGYLCS